MSFRKLPYWIQRFFTIAITELLLGAVFGLLYALGLLVHLPPWAYMVVLAVAVVSVIVATIFEWQPFEYWWMYWVAACVSFILTIVVVVLVGIILLVNLVAVKPVVCGPFCGGAGSWIVLFLFSAVGLFIHSYVMGICSDTTPYPRTALSKQRQR